MSPGATWRSKPLGAAPDDPSASVKICGVFELTRPACLDDRHWEAVSELQARLVRAIQSQDLALVIGTAKELCEAVARITWLLRGEQWASRTDMSNLIPTAHRLVDRLPASGGASGGAARDLAQAAMSIMARLVELRNRAGTGHGRPEPHGLDVEDARFAGGIALLWSGWMLARLDALVANLPETVAAAFRSDIFHPAPSGHPTHTGPYPLIPGGAYPDADPPEARSGIALRGRPSGAGMEQPPTLPVQQLVGTKEGTIDSSVPTVLSGFLSLLAGALRRLVLEHVSPLVTDATGAPVGDLDVRHVREAGIAAINYDPACVAPEAAKIPVAVVPTGRARHRACTRRCCSSGQASSSEAHEDELAVLLRP